jgi:hypothetical protein
MIIIQETDNRFYIDESKLPNAGLGCFAKVKIEKGDYLEIIGVLVENAGISDKCTHYGSRYKFAAEPEKEFKHSLIPMGYAAIVNQANNKEDQNVSILHLPEKVSCKDCKGEACQLCGGCGLLAIKPRNPNGGRTVYVALRDIEVGEELLGNYNKKIGHLVVDNQKFDEQDEWEKFLKHDLYGLGILRETK